jgi:hypothetical protein
MMSRNEYRIVRDGYLGFEVQWKPRWWPFWTRRGNTHQTVEKAEEWANKHANVVVRRLGFLPASAAEGDQH